MNPPDRRQLFRRLALLCVCSGAMISVFLMRMAGRRNPSAVLLILMSIWVLLPFTLLGILSWKSRELSQPLRKKVNAITPVMAFVMTLVYYAQAPKPAGAPNAFLFIAVPPLSCLLIATVIAVAAWRRRSAARSG